MRSSSEVVERTANGSGRPELPRLTRRDGVGQITAAMDEVGAVIVDDLVATPDLAVIVDELHPHLEAADPGMRHLNEALQTFYEGVRNVTGLVSRSRRFVDAMLLNPVLLGVADALILPNCASYTLNVAQLLGREPGSVQQWLHRDEEVWSFLPVPHEHVEIATMAALVDFTRENGATAVVPGSHRWEQGRQPEAHEIAYAEMPAGAGVIYLGSTIHAGGANLTDRPRPGIHMSYVAGWLRPEENNCLATPPEIARNLPRRAQELVGYGAHVEHGGSLGALDLRDPADMLAAGDLSLGPSVVHDVSSAGLGRAGPVDTATVCPTCGAPPAHER